jgi:hypothetical protein
VRVKEGRARTAARANARLIGTPGWSP